MADTKTSFGKKLCPPRINMLKTSKWRTESFVRKHLPGWIHPTVGSNSPNFSLHLEYGQHWEICSRKQ